LYFSLSSLSTRAFVFFHTYKSGKNRTRTDSVVALSRAGESADKPTFACHNEAMTARGDTLPTKFMMSLLNEALIHQQ
jgi:hypothetical protein